jgi:DNA relaxase NicK
VAQELVEEEIERGNDKRNSKLQGYHGSRAGGATFGVRYDGYICQLRGATARDNWHRLIPHASNVSRIDVQATFRFETPQTDLMRRAFDRARKAKMKPGRKPSFRLTWDTKKGQTLNFGSRSSDIFGRMYDKGRESKTEVSDLLIRQEVEYKNDPAMSVAKRLDGSEDEAMLAASLACSEFRDRAIITHPLLNGEVESARVATSSDDARRLAYIRASLSKTVQKVLRTFTVEEVIDALGLSDLVVSKSLIDNQERK